MAPLEDITLLLQKHQEGDSDALGRLTPLLYAELHRLAAAIFRRERPDHTLQPTALVNEAYLRMVDQSQSQFSTRAHFLAIAGRVMRQVLVDHARSRRAAKRGSGAPNIELDERLHGVDGTDASVLSLHEALEDLRRLDPRKAEVIELRYFGGLTGEEMAEYLRVSTATVARDLRMAQAWLTQQLTSSERPAE